MLFSREVGSRYPKHARNSRSRLPSDRSALLISENGFPLYADIDLPQIEATEWYVLALHDDAVRPRYKIAETSAPVTHVRMWNPFNFRPSRLSRFRNYNELESDSTFRGLAGLLCTLCEPSPNFNALIEAFSWCRAHRNAVDIAFSDPLNDPSFIEGVGVISQLMAPLVSELSAPPVTSLGVAHLARLLHSAAALAALPIPAPDVIYVSGSSWASIPATLLARSTGVPVVHDPTPNALRLPIAFDESGDYLANKLYQGFDSLFANLDNLSQLTIDLRESVRQSALNDPDGSSIEIATDATPADATAVELR